MKKKCICIMIFTNRVCSFFFFKEGSIEYGSNEYGSNEFRVINYNYLFLQLLYVFETV